MDDLPRIIDLVCEDDASEDPAGKQFLRKLRTEILRVRPGERIDMVTRPENLRMAYAWHYNRMHGLDINKTAYSRIRPRSGAVLRFERQNGAQWTCALVKDKRRG